jgi:hypothetical protein
MSSLVFWTTEDIIAVATDTRVSRPSDFLPTKFTTKAFAVPHLRAIIAGTGLQNYIIDWYAWVLLRSKAVNIDELDAEAKIFLNQLNTRSMLNGELTATIYHFGIGEDGKCKTFAYRSERNFESELLSYGLGIKPAYPEIFEMMETMSFENLQEEFSFIIREQRRRDDALENGKRVGIGGEMVLWVLTKDTYSISTFDKFEDYSEMKDRFGLLDYSGNDL